MEIHYYLAFSYFLGIGPMRFQQLCQEFGGAKSAYIANKNDLMPLLGEKLTAKFIDFRRKFDSQKELSLIQKKGIRILTHSDKSFPQSLLEIPDPPICLYVKGKIDAYDFKNNLCIGVVGTRMPTVYGQQITRRLVKELVEQQIIIVSGLALGIDALAHAITLESGGKTIAVLGCGLDIIYPAFNRYLYLRILENQGLIISEFPPSMPVAKGLFISRNRLISGLSRGVLVIEGSDKSGALITARYAAEQGKDVFATPAPINSQMSQAPNLLIKNGAKLVTGAIDILEEYGMQKINPQLETISQQFSSQEKIIYQLLKNQAATANELVINSGFNLMQVLNLISNLEILGIIAQNNEGKYFLKY